MIRKLIVICIAAVLAPLASVPAAFAQNRGAISGHVYDLAGIPLRGITITATSPSQIGGAQVTVSNDEGGFRLQGLFPGKFKLTVTAPKMRTLVQENVVVTGANVTDVDLLMDVDTGKAEEVNLVQKAPVVNPGSTRIGVVFDEDFMGSLPLPSRDYQGVASLAAGVRDTGDGNPQVRGGTYFSNNYTVDGFNTTDPVTRTFSQNFSFDSMASVEVTTAGGGAEMAGISGGNINTVTKSGSNRFELTTSGYYTDNHLQLFKDNLDRSVNRLAVASLYVGGPIIRDKLWYSVSGQYVDNMSALPSDPNFAPHPPLQIRGVNSNVKLSWRATQRNQFDLLAYNSVGAFNNLVQSPLVESEAEARQYQRTDFIGLTWQYTGEIFLLSRLGYSQGELDVGPQRCEWDPAHCATIPGQTDVITGVSRENYTSQSLDQRRTLQFSGQAEYIKDSRTWGNHQAKLSWSYRAMKQDRRSTVPGDFVFLNAGPDPFSRTEYCSSDPLSTQGGCVQNFLRRTVIGGEGGLTLGDAWKPTRYLTFKPEVAFHYGSSQNDLGLEVTNIYAFTPHLSVLWDPTHDGKTKLQASVDGKVDTGFLALAGFTSRQMYERDCAWDPTTGAYSADCTSQGGSGSQTVGLPCGPTGLRPDGSRCQTPLRPPRVWEATLGGQREIMTGVALGLTFIYKKFIHQWEDVETNANWNQGGTDLRQDGPFKSSRAQFVFDLQTPDAASREYRGVTAELRKREGLLKAYIAYTLSRYDGAVDADFATTFLDNPPQASYYYGPLPTDNRHDLRMSATYQASPWLTVGVNYEFLTGGPYNRIYFDPVYRQYSRFQAQRGKDSRGNLNPNDDLDLRYPDTSELGLQVRASLERFLKQKLFVWADLLNILSLRTPTAYVTQDGPSYGRLAGRMPPTRLRLGLEYRY
jgi:hypothetical protein